MGRSDTRELILDVAERQFARDGYHGASIRAITNEAGVNLASVNYHFGSKEELVRVVIERRIVPINEGRGRLLRETLEKSRGKSRAALLRGIIKSFVEPAFEGMESLESVSNISSIVMTSISEKNSIVGGIVNELMTPVFGEFQKALKQSLPGHSDIDLMWKIHFMIGIFLHTLRFARMDTIYGDFHKEMDREGLVQSMERFIEAGMKAK